MKSINIIILGILLMAAIGCSSSKKATKKKVQEVVEKSTTESVIDSEEIKEDAVPVVMSQEMQEHQERFFKQTNDYIASFPDSLVVAWERGGCYGRCPIYKVRVYKSGYAEYESVNFTDKENGIHATGFSLAEINEMIEKAKKMGIYELNTFYDTDVSDVPPMFAYINDNGNKKGVKDMRLGPRKFKDFVLDLDTYLEGKSFTLIKAKE